MIIHLLQELLPWKEREARRYAGNSAEKKLDGSSHPKHFTWFLIIDMKVMPADMLVTMLKTISLFRYQVFIKTGFHWRNQFSWLSHCWRGNWYKTFWPHFKYPHISIFPHIAKIPVDWVCYSDQRQPPPVSHVTGLYINISERKYMRSISFGKKRISQDIWRIENALANIVTTLSPFLSCRKFAKFRGHPEFRQLVHTTLEHCPIVHKCTVLKNYHLWKNTGGVFIMHILSAIWSPMNLIPPPN